MPNSSPEMEAGAAFTSLRIRTHKAIVVLACKGNNSVGGRMDVALERVLEEQSSRPLPVLTPRDTRVPSIEGVATALVGMRRVGKSYMLFQQMAALEASGVPRSSMLFLNLEDDRLGGPTTTMLDEALEHLFRTGPERYAQTAYLFLDEIQVVPGWERFVLRVINTENVRVFVTGSSAKLLSTEIATSLRGKSTAVEVLPFSFAEHLRHVGITPAEESVGAAKRSEMEAAFDRYLRAGGFPGVQTLPDIDRTRMLQDYVELVIFRDVVERWKVGNLVALRQLTSRLLSGFSREFTVNAMYKVMRDQGIAVGKDTLHAYLEHLVDARLLHTVGVRRASYKARLVNPRKVYAVDQGLALSVAHPSVDDTGHLLENTVYLELRRRFGRIHNDVVSYFTSKAGSADFIVDAGDSPPQVIQVSVTLSNDGTREREVRGAMAAMAELGVRTSTIVTLYEREILKTEAGDIHVVPAWRWMLGAQVR